MSRKEILRSLREVYDSVGDNPILDELVEIFRDEELAAVAQYTGTYYLECRFAAFTVTLTYFVIA